MLVIAVSPYIAASEMYVHISSLHKCNQIFVLSCSFFASHFFSRMANLSSGVDVVHATRQVCCPAEKTAGKKTIRLKKICVTFMQTRDMYLQFTRSNVWANGNR